MTHDRRFTAQKIAKRLDLIRPLAHRAQLPIEPFRVTYLPDADTHPPLGVNPAGWDIIHPNSYWGGQNRNFLLRSEMIVPAGWGAGPLALHLPMGVAGDIFTHPEALLYIDGRPFASADRYHHTIHLFDEFADGRPHRLELHGWTGLTGWPPDPHDRTQLFMKPCHVVEIDVPTRDFLTRAEVAWDVAQQLDDQRVEKYRILNALDQAFLRLDTRDPMGSAFYASVEAAADALEAGLSRAGPQMDVTLHAIGHAHMDVAYLWPVSQIRRKNGRTYSNVLRLMERLEDYRFSHSQPALYAMAERDYPDVFDGIKARVAEGRWEPMGGMWVEPDTNIPGGEALVRQLLLGRSYFKRTFGDVETPVLWLPDTFGMSWCLPQLIKQAGLSWMVTNKVNWNQYNKMTASTTWWEGIDGTRVLTHFLTTPRDVQHLPFPTNYKSDLSAAEVMGTWEQSTVKEVIDELPICYGYGDGGGGPTGELIRRGMAYRGMPGAPKLKFSTVRSFFEAIEKRTGALSVWADELYLEGHRGVLTSQGWIKRANRKAEVMLHETEFLDARAQWQRGMTGPHPAMRGAWERLCLNQFHDIVTGTSVTEVFDDARVDYSEITQRAHLAKAAALGSGKAWAAASTIPMALTRQVVVEEGLAAKLTGTAPRQPVADGVLLHMADVAPYSLTTPRADSPECAARVERMTDGSVVMENDLLRVEFDAQANLERIFDKRAAREVLQPGQRGNRLQAFEDRPISWDAWDIDAFFEDRGEIITGVVGFEVHETGPLRVAVRITRSYRNSTIRQEVRLRADSARLDFVTEVDWHETHILLKVAFPVQVFSPMATYEIQWGSIMRPTHRNTLWDYAKFEVPAQKWADLSEAGYGVALLNDCKYGYDIHKDVMRLSLIKSATMPDPVGDQGLHRFTYALLPHQGDWRGEVMAEAHDLNAPLAMVQTDLPVDARAMVSVDQANVVIETIKPAEDGQGVILRLYEAHRQRGPVTLRFARPPASAEVCNLLEDPIAPAAINEGAITLNLRPFEIVSLRIRP